MKLLIISKAKWECIGDSLYYFAIGLLIPIICYFILSIFNREPSTNGMRVYASLIIMVLYYIIMLYEYRDKHKPKR